MERHDLDSLISKKQRIDSTITEDIPNLKSEASSKVGESICMTNKFSDSIVYRLYFKGLVSDKTTMDNEKMIFAGIGVAICDDVDNLLFEMKESVDATKILCQVEILGAICGINHSIQLGIKNVVIYCDHPRIYQLINGRGNPSTQMMEDLVGEFIHYKEKLASSEIVLVAPNDIKFAYRLARDVIASQISSNACGVKWKIFQRECPSGCVDSYYDDYDVDEEDDDDDDDEDEDEDEDDDDDDDDGGESGDGDVGF
ncbi:PREDICTED: uncharacterized protein LOC104722604 [Camelina sativa]|uniref:Uncharacterized protein LOC104722604 n=1 Tax=Camelina sativa TaxID=90675 RepID=A0ABM0UCE5_CAMSA|nr:PREDICTED: uncharacterized protein LOC104722604 [Camelina sativa]